MSLTTNIQDIYASFSPGYPFVDIVSITPDDSSDLSTCVILVADGAGDAAVVTAAGQSRTIYLKSGVPHPVYVRKVLLTGTTATTIQGLVPAFPTQ